MGLAAISEQALADIDHVVRRNYIGGLYLGLAPFTVAPLAPKLDSLVAAARGHAARQRNRLHHRHVRLDAVSAPLRHFPVDVDHGGPGNEYGIAAAHVDIFRAVALDDRGQVDRNRVTLAAIRLQDDLLGSVGIQAARHCDHVADSRGGAVELVAAGIVHVAEHRDEPAARLQDADTDLGVEDVLAALQAIRDAPGRLVGGHPA